MNQPTTIIATGASARIDGQLADLAKGQDPAVADFINEIRKAVAEAPDAHAALWDVLDIMQDDRRSRVLRQAACMPGCENADPEHETCSGPRTDLPIPFGLTCREDQLLTVQLVRVRDEGPNEDDWVAIGSGGNAALLTTHDADQFADQLIGFAAAVRSLSRQAAALPEAAKAHA